MSCLLPPKFQDPTASLQSLTPPLTKQDCRSALNDLLAFQENYQNDPLAKNFCFFPIIKTEIQQGIEKVAAALLYSTDWQDTEEKLPTEVAWEVTTAAERLQSHLFCPLGSTLDNKISLVDPVIDPTAKKSAYVFERASLQHFFGCQPLENLKNTDMQPITAVPEEFPSHPMLQDLIKLLQTHFPKEETQAPIEKTFLAYRSDLRQSKERIREACVQEVCRTNQESVHEQQVLREQIEEDDLVIKALAKKLIAECTGAKEKELTSLVQSIKTREAFCLSQVAKAEERISDLEEKMDVKTALLTQLHVECGTLQGTLLGLEERLGQQKQSHEELTKRYEALERLSEQERSRGLAERTNLKTQIDSLRCSISSLEIEQSRLRSRVSSEESRGDRLERDMSRLSNRVNESRGCCIQ